MDLFSLFCVLYILFISVCLAIIFLSDSDILTFMYAQFGKAPDTEYPGKVVWITGASSGIGEAIAIQLAKCNAKLVLSARRENELERVKKACLAANLNLRDSDVLVLPVDMLDLTSHEPAFKKIIAHFGKLDVLISNAGRSQRAYWHEIHLDVDKELFDLNVFSVIHMNRLVVNHFLKNGGGQLAVVSSVTGKMGVPNSGTYCGSKHALHGYFEGLRVETFGKNIDVTMLCPGPVFSQVLTNAFTNQPGEKVNQEMQATDRRLTAERCAHLMLVAMANRLNESWMSLLPVIPVLYLNAYQPYLFAKITRLLGSGYFQKVRDSRDTLKKD